MKRSLFFSILIAIVSVSCQPKAVTPQVNVEAEKAAIAGILDKIYTAMNSRDVNPFLSLLTDDVLVCGTDSKEFWNKTEITQMFTQMMADTTVKMNFKVDKREIRISKDGNSAVVIEQMIADFISSKIPLRRISHMVKLNDAWKMDFDSSNMIPNNEDIPRLNKALE